MFAKLMVAGLISASSIGSAFAVHAPIPTSADGGYTAIGLPHQTEGQSAAPLRHTPPSQSAMGANRQEPNLWVSPDGSSLRAPQVELHQHLHERTGGPAWVGVTGNVE
jgi:hypothetical protein